MAAQAAAEETLRVQRERKMALAQARRNHELRVAMQVLHEKGRKPAPKNAGIAPPIALRETIAQKQAGDHSLPGLIFHGQANSKEAMEKWRRTLTDAPNDDKSRRALERAQTEMEEILP